MLISLFLKRSASFLFAALVLLMLQPINASADHRQNAGSVYVMTNEASGNSVIQFRRGGDGLLSPVGAVSTQGLGSGGSLDPLTSQNSLVLSGSGRLLFAVNAGSNDVSVLSVSKKGLSFLSKTSSGGEFPNSIAVHRDLVYVLNAHGTPNITGFRLHEDGTLEAIPNSTQDLPGGTSAAPAQVSFSPDGTLLFVTETGTSQIDIFEVDDEGLAVNPVTQASPGTGPFGFTFGRRSVLLVTEAATGSLSSFRISDQNSLNVISAAVPSGQLASCWIAIGRGGRFAFVSNTASSTISSYQVGPAGDVKLLNPVAVNTGVGSAPIDSALSGDGRFLYVVDSTRGKILLFRVGGASLAPLGAVSGLPTSIQGIAAR